MERVIPLFIEGGSFLPLEKGGQEGFYDTKGE